MDKDMDAIRKILFAVRDADTMVKKVEGVPDDVFKFNAMFLIEADLVKGKFLLSSGRDFTPVPNVAMIERLTWKGSDFTSSLNDDALWGKAKKLILAPAVSWTFSLLSEYLKKEAQTKLGF